MRLFRLLKIAAVASRYGLDEMVLEHEPTGRLVRLANTLQFWRDLSAPRAVRLRMALEALGPIFVKFGQVLSTRRDLMPADIADELAKLQDQVPPFDSHLALAEIEKAYGRPAHEVFAEFDPLPIASASIAQVHFARLRAEDGSHEVAVKVLRPNMLSVIEHDLALMDNFALLLEKLWADGKRLKPREVVAEYLDRSRLAAAATLSRTNDFHEDELVPVESRSTLADYRGSGFDRGHLAPNGDMGTRDQQFDSFALSNIVPQNRIHNQGVWRKLEEATRALVKQRDAAYVVTGVVFETDTLSMAGSVLVPTALYKAVYFPGQQQAGAYWSPNDARGQVTVLSLTELEHRTGIVVMPGIGKTILDRAMSLPLDARSPRSIVRESGQQDTLRRIPNDPFYWPARDALLYLLRKLKMMVD